MIQLPRTLHAPLLLLALLVSSVAMPHFARAEPAGGEPFTFGVALTLTGYGEKAGEAELNGIRLAVEEINAAKGIKDHLVALKVEDTRSDQKSTAAAMQKLASVDKVPVILGPNWAEFAEVGAPIAQQNGIVMLTPSGYTKTLTKARPFVFSALENHPAVVRPLSDLIIKRAPKKLVMLVVDNAYFKSLQDSITEQIAARGITVWKTVHVPPQTKDFRTFVTRFKADGVDAVMMLLLEDGSDFAFLKQKRELGFKAQVFSGNSIPYDDAFKIEPTIADDVIIFNYDAAMSDEFIRKYKMRFKTDPMFDSSRAYDLVYAVKNAAEHCGITSDEIRRCLTKLSYDGVSGPIGFDSNRNLRIYGPVSHLFKMKDGKELPVTE